MKVEMQGVLFSAIEINDEAVDENEEVLKKEKDILFDFYGNDLTEFLSNASYSFLKMCFDEVEGLRVNGYISGYEIKKMNNYFFNGSPISLHMICSEIYREISLRHFELMDDLKKITD